MKVKYALCQVYQTVIYINYIFNYTFIYSIFHFICASLFTISKIIQMRALKKLEGPELIVHHHLVHQQGYSS